MRYFLAVAEALSFRKAGDRLHVSHPALSKQIRDLECELGVSLLERNTVRVLLTPAGRQFQKDASDILARADKMRNRVRELSVSQNQLLIGWPGPFGEYFLPQILSAFRQLHPDVNIRILGKNPNEQIQALLAGKIDIAFAPTRVVQSCSSINHKLLIKSPLGVVLSKNHRLCRYKTLTSDQIRKETFWYLGPVNYRSIHLADIKKALHDVTLKPSQLKNAEELDSLLTFIISGNGITMLPRALVTLRTRQVCFRKLTDINDHNNFEFCAIWRKQPPSALLSDFLSFLKTRRR